MRMIPNWRTELHRLWSSRLAIYLGVLNGLALGIAALVDWLNPWLFIGLNVLTYAAIAVLRIIKQPEPKEIDGDDA